MDKNNIAHSALKERSENENKKSGFLLLPTGEMSLDARLEIIRLAEETLDLQYYAIHDDLSSNVIIEAVIQAAERGVKVRFLIDDITTSDLYESLHILDLSPNIDVKIFNPVSTNAQDKLSRFISLMTNMERANKRMHNKALISDNHWSIVGGRNLGDEYFDQNPDVSFKDIDVLAAGPITLDIAKSFKRFWDDQDTYNLKDIHSPNKNKKFLSKVRKKLRTSWKKYFHTKDRHKQFLTPKPHHSYFLSEKLIPARGSIYADDPAKIRESEDVTNSEPATMMIDLLKQAKEEFIIISSYFVPKKDGVSWIDDLQKRGVKVRILTNSLASTDVVAVHAGYRRYRSQLIKTGADLFEMMPTHKNSKQRLLATTTPSQASLHAKMYIIDRKYVFVGSFNFDPRSVLLNTEIALLIDNEDIAAQAIDIFEKSIHNSYQVGLNDRDELIWTDKENNKTIKNSTEPEASIWRKIQVNMMALLPIENKL